jgi:hypothetical protein
VGGAVGPDSGAASPHDVSKSAHRTTIRRITNTPLTIDGIERF